ncbi:hypothetical protein LIER_13789 [Lithospermum erythrorhizon]|uniref:DUF6821 domain-containing protein n=1 Tax=Lithospermum erythrorhizon TaxID=34254 RepID=A0AAV3PWP2_LITER
MEVEGSELQDWEVLSEPFIGDVAESEESSGFVEGMIQTNYFSLDSPKNNIVSDDNEVSCKHFARSLSESSSELSDGKGVSEFEGKYDVGFVQNDQNGKFLEGVDEVEHLITENDQNENFLEGFNGVEDMVTENEGKSDVDIVENDQKGNFIEGFNGVEHMVTENDNNLEKFSDDLSGSSSGEMTVEGDQGSGELGMKEDEISGEECSEREASEEKGEAEVSEVQEEKKKKSGIVWWKLPIEFLRYCVFKGPVWTVSVAAAFMGLVVLGRRLYTMKKKKSKALGPRITMDDKKISQFMSDAARLNEAFSVVKRVPVIRPSLPAGGVTPWPVVSLR